MSSVVACCDHFKRGVTSCCYLIIASFISADSVHFDNFQSSHGGISPSLTSCFDVVI